MWTNWVFICLNFFKKVGKKIKATPSPREIVTQELPISCLANWLTFIDHGLFCLRWHICTDWGGKKPPESFDIYNPRLVFGDLTYKQNSILINYKDHVCRNCVCECTKFAEQRLCWKTCDAVVCDGGCGGSSLAREDHGDVLAQFLLLLGGDQLKHAIPLFTRPQTSMQWLSCMWGKDDNTFKKYISTASQ